MLMQLGLRFTGWEQDSNKIPAIGESLSPINQAVGELPRDEYTLW
jgi:hypothetical protein